MPNRGDSAVLAILVVARILFAAQYQSVGALGPALVTGLAHDFATLGALIGMYQLVGCVISLPSGALLARLGEQRVLMISIPVMALGGATLAVAPNVPVALAARCVSGAGGILLNIVLLKLVLDRFSGPSLPIAIGWIGAAWPGGIALSLLVLPMIAGPVGWRGAMGVVAVVVGLLLLAVPFMGAGGPVSRSGDMISGRPASWFLLLLGSAAWMTYNIGFVLPLGFIPTIFSAHGMDPAQASRFVSIASWVATLMIVVGGWVTARTGRPFLFTVVCLSLMAVSCLLIPLLPFGWPAAAALLSFGLFGGLIGAPLFALVTAPLSAAARSFASGVIYTIFYLGLTVIPPLAGFVRDVSADPAMPIWIATVLSVAAIAALFAMAAVSRANAAIRV